MEHCSDLALTVSLLKMPARTSKLMSAWPFEPPRMSRLSRPSSRPRSSTWGLGRATAREANAREATIEEASMIFLLLCLDPEEVWVQQVRCEGADESREVKGKGDEEAEGE